MVLLLFGTDYFPNKKTKTKYTTAGIEKTNYTLFTRLSEQEALCTKNYFY